MNAGTLAHTVVIELERGQSVGGELSGNPHEVRFRCRGGVPAARNENQAVEAGSGASEGVVSMPKSVSSPAERMRGSRHMQ